ncbi:MAG: hypothetical protein RQ752_00440 [Thermohalobaculum sp.]|nr:hypothetical protein [Thermohalobaculum sp.]
MGKTIDKFLKDIDAKADSCQKTSANFKLICEAWTTCQADWDKYEPEMLKLKNWEDHPYAKKRIAVWEKGKSLSADLLKNANEMNTIISGFNVYISKREKSKNPFRSKKSLPAARGMIDTYSKVAKDYVQLALHGRSLFR